MVRLHNPLLPLPREKSQPVILRRKGNLAPLGKEEHVPGLRCDLLPRLVRDFEAAFHDDLHLVVGVCIHKGRTLLEPIEACGYGRVGIHLFAGEDVAWCIGGVSRHPNDFDFKRQRSSEHVV